MTNTEKNQIRGIISSPQWGAVEALKKELIEQIRSEPKLKDTIDETGLKTAFDEGQVYGVERLFKEIFNSQL